MPSPSTSLMVTPHGDDPVMKSTLAANELIVIEPEVLVFLKTETILDISLVTAKSGLPSPSMSPRIAYRGAVPTVKSTFAANEPVVREPKLLVFLNIETVLLT